MRLGLALALPMMGKGGGTATAPSFLNGATFSAPEGADFDYGMSFSEACDVVITGGAQANSYGLPGPNSNVTTAPLRLFSQVFGGANNYVVIVQITSHATGLTASQTITGTVTDVAAPTVNVAGTIANQSGGAWEGSTLVLTPTTWNNAVSSVTQQWQVGGVNVTGATGLTYLRQFSDIGNGVITCVETAVGQGGSGTSTSASKPATISGRIFAFGVRNTDGFVTDTSRWSHLITNENVFAAGKHPTGDSVTLYKGKTVGTAADRTNTFPPMLAGFLSTTLASTCIVGAVPTATAVLVRAACGSDGAGSTQGFLLTTDDWTSSAGTNIAQTTTGVVLTNGQLANFNPTPGVTTGEIISTFAAWEASASWFPVTTTATGALSLGRVDATHVAQIRAFECIYPEYNINYLSSNLAGNTAFSDIASGNDSTGVGTTAAPFQHIAGDPGGTGVVPSFTISVDGFNKLKAGTYRPPTYTGRGGLLINSSSLGTSGHPVTLTCDTGAAVIIDGSVLLTGWVAVNSGDTGGSWENPNHANLQKKTGLTGAQTMLCDGEDRMFPAQFPVPSNPADVGYVYVGTDAYINLTPTQFNAQVVEDADNTIDSSGNAGAGGYHKVKITSPDVQARYSADAINISTVAQALVYIAGNRITALTVHNHVPATGYFEVFMPDSIHMFHVSGSQTAYLAIRGHPYDIRTVGQYAYDAGGNAIGHFANATRARISSDLNYGFKPANDYNTLKGEAANPLILRRVGYNGAAIADTLGAAARLGMVVSDVRLSQVQASTTSTRVAQIKAVTHSTGSFANLYIDGCQEWAGIEQEGDIAFNGVQARDLDGTIFTQQTPPTSTLAHKNFDSCDMIGAHANGVAHYQTAANTTYSQMLMLNIGIPFSTQGGDGVVVRSNVFKNGWFLGRRGYAGNVSLTVYTWQWGDGETAMSAEGLLVAGAASYGRTSGSNKTSSGSVVKNCVFLTLFAVLDLAGITFQDCLFCCADTSPGSINSVADITGKGGTDGGGNVFYDGAGGRPAAGTFVYGGTINADMQKALTANHGAGTYTARNIGIEATAFNNTGKALLVPAFGASFDIHTTAYDTWLSTTTVRKLFRAGLDFAVLGNPAPDLTYSLPVGQGDNAKFALNGCYVNMPTGTGGSAGTLNLVVDATTTNANVVGGQPQTRRTTIPITVF